MVYIFLILSLIGSVFFVGHRSGFLFPALLWQLPLAFIGFFLAFVLLFLLILFLSCIMVDMRKRVKRPSRYFLFLLNQFSRLAFFLGGVKLHTEGLDKVPAEGRFMMVSNHLSIFDPILFYSAFPNMELSFIAKKESFSFYLVSQVMHQLLCLPIDRENDREALKSIIKAIQLLREDRTSIFVFPEGYTSKTGQLQPFRNGTFKIAQKAGVPIVVCSISNTKAIRKNMFRRHTDVYLSVHTVISYEDLADKTTIEVGDRIHAIMEAGIAARNKA
ncbi:MAG: 1-acyl-sn-glycerol-3-phosphate acyltransferase [Clostridia bacterium]|nr:1-acyl-sn-glycerol-3-phosphate acyltransferase [Clostridia bacterium]